jgi:predicted RNA-binding protein
MPVFTVKLEGEIVAENRVLAVKASEVAVLVLHAVI